MGLAHLSTQPVSRKGSPDLVRIASNPYTLNQKVPKTDTFGTACTKRYLTEWGKLDSSHTVDRAGWLLLGTRSLSDNDADLHPKKMSRMLWGWKSPKALAGLAKGSGSFRADLAGIRTLAARTGLCRATPRAHPR